MCSSLIRTIFDWLMVIGACWLGLLALILATVLFWQLVTLIIEDFKDNDDFRGF